jgi:diphosphomevalonate decarboxylase
VPDRKATALAHPNIAFIKYWGNRDERLRLPANGSISMNLDGLETRTQVTFEARLRRDSLSLNGKPVSGAGLERVAGFLDEVRRLGGLALRARVESENNFPAGAGIASSAAAFAALALAACAAASLDLDEAGLSRLARRGSGSACRSVPGGFTEWRMGTGDLNSYAVCLAPPEYWDLVDCLAMLDSSHKPTGSTEGHALAGTSPLQAARVADAPRRLDLCRNAIRQRDFEALAEIVELDSNLMHAVMMTSTPPLFYWQPATLAVLQAVRAARRGGLAVCATLDAGPNVHVISTGGDAPRARTLLESIPGVDEVRLARAGGPARLVS